MLVEEEITSTVALSLVVVPDDKVLGRSLFLRAQSPAAKTATPSPYEV